MKTKVVIKFVDCWLLVIWIVRSRGAKPSKWGAWPKACSLSAGPAPIDKLYQKCVSIVKTCFITSNNNRSIRANVLFLLLHLFFTSNFAVFVGGVTKIFFASGRRHWRNWWGRQAAQIWGPFLEMGSPLFSFLCYPNNFINFKPLLYANLFFCSCSSVFQSFAKFFFQWYLHYQDCSLV